jgi:tripartite-type tricarboxylate transporter receptor subunit TctC
MTLARFFPAVLALAIACIAGLAQAQGTVRMLVGYPPGGAVDTLGRVFAERLSEAIGQPVIVETRAGASGQLAAAALKAAAPDGNTLMVVPEAPIVLSPHTVKTPLPYDTLKDFVGVAHVGGFDYGLAIGAGVPAADLKSWIELVKADRKYATYGSAGAGTTPHFLGLVLSQAIGVPLVHVPYRGVGPATTDLLGGQIPAVMLPFAQMLPLVKAGKIRILAQAGSKRAANAPEIPTFKELGYPSMEVSGWYSILAPAGLRADLLARYNEIFVQAQRTPAVRERMRALDLDIVEMSPADLAARFRAEHARWAPIVKASGFSADSQ